MKGKLKSLTAGALAGLVNGLMGAGGGTVAAPLYMRWLKLEDKKALATTVMTIFPLCALSAAVYALGGKLSLQNAWPYLAGGLAGGILGGLLFKKTPAMWLRRGFGALLVLGGLRMLFW